MEFVGDVTRDKLISTSCEGFRNKNIISKEGIPKSNMNMTSPSSKLDLGCSPHKGTCDLFSDDLVSHRLQAYS